MGYKPDLTIEEEIKTTLFKEMPQAKAEYVWRLVRKASTQRARAAQCTIPTDEGTKNANKRMMNTENDTSGNKRHKLSTNPEDIVTFTARDYPSELKKAQGRAEKVRVCVAAAVDVQAQVKEGKDLLEPAKSFSYRVGRVAQCVSTCYGNDVDAFISENKGPVSKFKTCAKGTIHKPTFARNNMGPPGTK